MADIGKDLIRARKILEAGGLVAIPTETVYGLAGNALNASAVLQIFKVKNRPQFDPLIIHVPDASHVVDYVEEFPPRAQKLARMFWPGPITLLLKRKSVIPDLVTAGLEHAGIRCPQHPLTTALLQQLSFPLAAPSANPFGYISPTRPEHVNEQLGDQIDYILDGGECRIGIESTIIGFEENLSVIYRLGGISVEKIEAAIGPVTLRLNISSNPQAPGQLASHYAPGKKLLIGNILELMKQQEDRRVGIITFQKPASHLHTAAAVVLSPSGNLDEAAQKLFAALRYLDQQDIDLILAELVPDTGIGKAINDRLRRAAAC
jgi:L-threonylcarbamoyladenylate synthase